jgi:DtxR family transcriptional regulator, Mn-dependent transcriptional regulator
MSPELRALSIRAVDCLRLIYKFHERGERVTTSAMRERLQVLESSGQLSDAAVTQLFKSLADAGFVLHTPYHGVELTERGEQLAKELVRHHRLLELFLAQALGYRLDEVDAEAERLEHAISEDFEDRLDALLGHPIEDPHGDPIPSKSGEVLSTPTRSLTELKPGQTAVVRRVLDDDAELLRYLETLGLVPGASVMVKGQEPFGGPLIVRVGGTSASPSAGGKEPLPSTTERAVGLQAASGVWVAES